MKTISTTGLECPHCHSVDEESYEHELGEGESVLTCEHCEKDFIASQEMVVTYEAETIAAYYYVLEASWVYGGQFPRRGAKDATLPFRATKMGAFWSAMRLYATQQANYEHPREDQSVAVSTEWLRASCDQGSSRIDDQSPVLQEEVTG